MLKMDMDDPLSSSSSLCACGGINNNINRKRKFKDGIFLTSLQKHKNPKTEQQEEDEEEEVIFENNDIIQLRDIKVLQDMRKQMMMMLTNTSNGSHSLKQDSIMSLSDNDDDDDNAKQQLELELETYPYKHVQGNSTSSVNWSGTSTTSFCPCPSFEDDEVTTTTSSGYEQTKQLEEMEDLFFCSNGNETSNHYVLSSGRWDINNQDTQQGTQQKLTIDKEFEQYFSMLML